MNTRELQERLLAEGCNQNSFSIEPWGHNNDVLVLEKINGAWEIYYTERGRRDPPMAEFRNESDACEYYYQKITEFEHRHIVSSYEDEAKAKELQSVLDREGIPHGRNDCPPLKSGRPRLKRVYVVGTDIFKVRKLYKNLPLRDYEN